MFDAIYASYSRKKDKLLDPQYKPSDSIKSKKLLNRNADKLAVIFPSWHTHNFPVNILAKRLKKKGWAVLLYDFHDQIMESDEDIVVNSFRYIRDSVANELKELEKRRNYKQIHFIGISLGNVPLTLVTDKFPNFSSATIVVGGDDLAIDMWHGLRTSGYRDAFLKMHIGIRKLDKEWQVVSPINHVRHFAHKKIKIYISLHDKFVGTEYQKKLAEKIQQTGGEVKIKKSHLGHTLSIVRFCLFEKPF